MTEPAVTVAANAKKENEQLKTLPQNDILKIKQELDANVNSHENSKQNGAEPIVESPTKIEIMDYTEFKAEITVDHSSSTVVNMKKEKVKKKRKLLEYNHPVRRKSSRTAKIIKKDVKVRPQDVTTNPICQAAVTVVRQRRRVREKKSSIKPVNSDDTALSGIPTDAVDIQEATVREEPVDGINLQDVEIVEPTDPDEDLDMADVADQQSETGPYLCDICNKTLATGSQMQRHLQSHQNERNYRCDQCDRTYKSSSSLSGHLKTCHSGERPFVCRTCGKTFPRQNSLNRHNMIHTGVKPFACQECGKRFPQSSYLKAHMRNHTGEKPFQCLDCGERFKHSGYLMDHRRRIHTGEKRHECGTCGKLFARASDRLRHERTHNETKSDAKRQHKCHECGSRFKFREKLDSHTMEGKCKRSYRINRAKPNVTKLKVKVKAKVCTVAPKQGRKQLKPRRAKLKELEGDSGQSDSSLASQSGIGKRRVNKKEIKEIENHTTPLVFFEDDPPRLESKSLPESSSTSTKEESKYRCETCSEKFEHSSALIDHHKIHKKPFRCLTCDLSFTWSLDLVKHTKSHSDRGENYQYEIYTKRYQSEHDDLKVSPT